jgi:hypothetical protein
MVPIYIYILTIMHDVRCFSSGNLLNHYIICITVIFYWKLTQCSHDATNWGRGR